MHAVRNAYWTAMVRLWRAAERVTARLRHSCGLREVQTKRMRASSRSGDTDND